MTIIANDQVLLLNINRSWQWQRPMIIDNDQWWLTIIYNDQLWLMMIDTDVWRSIIIDDNQWQSSMIDEDRQ